MPGPQSAGSGRLEAQRGQPVIPDTGGVPLTETFHRGHFFHGIEGGIFGFEHDVAVPAQEQGAGSAAMRRRDFLRQLPLQKIIISRKPDNYTTMYSIFAK